MVHNHYIWNSMYGIVFINAEMLHSCNSVAITLDFILTSNGSNVPDFSLLQKLSQGYFQFLSLIFGLYQKAAHTQSCDAFIKEVSRSLPHFEEVTLPADIIKE